MKTYMTFLFRLQIINHGLAVTEIVFFGNYYFFQRRDWKPDFLNLPISS